MEETKENINVRKPIKLPPITWQAYEYDYKEKHPDWFWKAGLAGGAAIILSIFFKNFLFAIVLLLGTFTAMMYAARKPELVDFSITDKGITYKNNLYPFEKIKAFAMKNEDGEKSLLIHSDRIIMPHIFIPLGNANPDQIYDRLANVLPEEKFRESAVDLLMEYFGF